MTVLRSIPTMNMQSPKSRAIAGISAVAVAIGVTLAIILATGGDGTPPSGGDGVPAVGEPSPLAPDTDVAADSDVTPDTVQLEPGDTPPPTGDVARDLPLSGGEAGGTMLAGGPGISIGEALASTLSGPLLVNGVVVIVDGEAQLCSVLAESFPPQCGGDSIRVSGLDVATLELQTEGKVSWTNDQVQLLGFVRDGVLVIDNEALAAGGGALPVTVEGAAAPLATDGPGLGPADSAGDVTSLTFGTPIRAANIGVAAFSAEEDLSFESDLRLHYDFEAGTVSASVFVDAFVAEAAVQGEGPITVRFSVSSGAIELVSEAVDYGASPIAQTTMPVRSVEPVRIVATRGDETQTFDAFFVGEVGVNYVPEFTQAHLYVSLDAAEMPEIFGFIADVGFHGDVRLTAEQFAILEAQAASR